MQKATQFFWLISGAFFVAGVLFLAGITSSLWFLEAVVPDSPGAVLVGRDPQAGEETVSRASNLLLSSEAAAASELFSVFVIRENADGAALAGIPSLQRYIAAPRQLRADGWQTQRIGWIIYASRGEVSLPSISGLNAVLRGYGGVFSRVIQSTYPLHPAAVAEITPRSLGGDVVSEALLTSVQSSKGALQLDVREPDALPALPFPADLAEQASAADFLFAGPGELLQRIPAPYYEDVNERLSRGLGFVHTEPDVLELLAATQRAAVIQHGDQTAVLVSDTESIRQALINEAAYQYPTRSAFRLPDGTIGYEVVPDPSAVVLPEVAEGECGVVKGEDREHVFCLHEGGMIISASPEEAQRLRSLAIDQPGWYLLIGTMYREELPLQITGVEAAGTEEAANLRIFTLAP